MAFPENEDLKRKDQIFEAKMWGASVGILLGLFVISRCSTDTRELCSIYCEQKNEQLEPKNPTVWFWSVECACAKKEKVDLRIFKP